MSDDIFSRLYEAGKEAAKPFNGVKAAIPWVIMVFIGLGFGKASDWSLEMLSPPTKLGQAALVILIVWAVAWPIALAYRLQAKIRELHKKYTALPEPERALILELRTVAGQALHPYTDMPFAGSLRNPAIQNLHDLCGKLRRHEGIYRTGVHFASSLSWLSVSHITAREMIELRVIEELTEKYDRLLYECDLVLKPSIDPPPSTASSQSPPSSRESSE